MNYLLVGNDYKVLYIEGVTGHAFWYSKSRNEWMYGDGDLSAARTGFDESEPEGSPYRYGNMDMLKDIDYITKEAAEEFIGKKLNEEKLKKMLGE